MRKLKIFLEMIKFEHTLFAFPFAYLGAMITGKDLGFVQAVWIALAMIGARSTAMGLNRLIDRVIDKNNPRTANRAIPMGRLTVSEVMLFIVISFIIFCVSTYQLAPLCMKLLPIAIVCLVLYSYTKRFTYLCHFFLGFTIGLAPLGGYVAISNRVDVMSLILYVSVSFWTAGFDIIYACQDMEFDQKTGLYSIPARFGLKNALRIAQGCHILTAVGFFLLGLQVGLGLWYWIGLAISYGLLFYQHWLMKSYDLRKVNTAFFTMNGALSIVMFLFTWIDLWRR